MRSDITAVILAGGQSQRFGSNKALAKIDETHLMIEKIADVLKDVFEEIFILTKDKNKFEILGKPWLTILNDQSHDFHPLNGLASALFYSKTEKIFLCGCDMPFINSELIHLICSKSQDHDAAVPIWQGTIQPLCGVYSKKCLAAIDTLSMLNDPRKGLRYLLSQVNTKMIEEKEFHSGDGGELAFFDIDTPADFQKALKILRASYAH